MKENGGMEAEAGAAEIQNGSPPVIELNLEDSIVEKGEKRDKAWNGCKQS